MRLNEILFPTDFSAASEVAGRVAREMAVRADARLHVLHVVPPMADPSQSTESLARAARRFADGLRAETVLLSGWAGRHIIDYAREKRIDLIVLGTHGRTGITHAILGSVAETVVRLAPCLVLTVPVSILTEPSAPAAPPVAAVSPRPCLVCGGSPGGDLICESCRTRIRGEAVEQNRAAERSGHKGLPV